MVRRLGRSIAALLLGMAALVQAAEQEEHFVDRFVIQYAGMLGMISMGVENTTGSHSDFQFLAGYTPASAAGIDIYSLGVRANYVFNPLYRNEFTTGRIYSGIGLYYYLGEQYQTYDYPNGYYTHPATEWHLMPYLGLRLSGVEPSLHGITFYTEAGIIDSYLIHYYNNHQTISLSDAVSLALGVTLPLR